MKTPNVRPTLLPLAFGAAALALLAACESADSHVVSAPPPPAPVLTTTTPTATPVVIAASPDTNLAPTGTIVVTQMPPAAVAEVRVAQPSPRHAWVPGYWTWRDNQYQWMAGHWEIPPFANAVWTPPTWAKEGNAYRFYEGAWK